MSDTWITAVGGPLDGRDWPCRFPAGLVLINKPKGEVLIYDKHADRLVAREITQLDDQRAAEAAESETRDVLAYDAEVMGPWQR